MNNKIKIADLPEFDITEHLDSEQAIAKQSGLTRETLYKALRSDAHPSFDTIAGFVLRWV